MKPHTQAVREAQAWERIRAAVKRLASEAGGDVPGLDATHRDAGLQQLYRVEALADFLEGATLPKPETPAPDPVPVQPEVKPDPVKQPEVRRDRTK